MSSQGPRVDPSASIAHNDIALDPEFGTPTVSKGYQFTTAGIRDGSDWIAYKRQLRILNDDKVYTSKDPWFTRGNDFRLQRLEGQYKKPEECDGCDGNAFINELTPGGGGNQGRIYLGRQNAKTIKFYDRPDCPVSDPLDSKYYTVYTFVAPSTGFFDVTGIPYDSETLLFISNINTTLSSSDISYTASIIRGCVEDYIPSSIQNYLDIYPESDTLQRPIYMNAGDTVQLLLLPYFSPDSKFTSTFYVTKNTTRANLGYEMFESSNYPDLDDPTSWGTRDDTRLSNLLTVGDGTYDDGRIIPILGDTFDNTALRGYGFITPNVTGDYAFYVTHDDGLYIRMNGQNIYSNYSPGDNNSTNTIFLYAGMKYSFEFVWANGSGVSLLQIPSYQIYDYDTDTTTYYTDFNSLTSRSPDLFVPRELWVNPFMQDDGYDYASIYVNNNFAFSMDGNKYGDNWFDYIYISTANILYFGSPNSYNPSSYQDWLDNAADGPAILLGAGYKYTTYNNYYTDVQTSGDYQWVAIITEWQDQNYGLEDGTSYSQIRLIVNTVTKEQWVEYKTELSQSYGTNIWQVYVPNHQQDVFQGAFDASNPAPGSSFLLYNADGYGNSWVFQNNKSLNV